MSGSNHHGKLCSILMKETFGKDAEIVAMHLYRFGHRTLQQIAVQTRLRIEKVQVTLKGLINYNLVKCSKPSETNSTITYSLRLDRVLFLERYIRCVPILTKKFETEGEMLLDTLLKNGCCSASGIILQAANRLLNTQQEHHTPESALLRMWDRLKELVRERFVFRTASRMGSKSKEVMPLGVTEAEKYQLPELDLPLLCAKLTSKDLSDGDQRDRCQMWTIKMARITQLLRDEMLAKSLACRVDDHAGNLVRVLLHMMARSDPWSPTSQSFGLQRISQEVKRLCPGSPLDDENTLAEYLQVLVDDSSKLVNKSPLEPAYVVTMKSSLEELAWSAIERIVQEQFGYKGVSVFRVVRLQKYRDQDVIQESAMITPRETKQMTYRLMGHHFLQVRELKLGGAGTEAGRGATSYLFYINLNQVVRMCVENCYVAMYSARMRQEDVTNRCAYLLNKQEQVDSLIKSLEEGSADNQRQIVEDLMTPLEQKELDKVKLWKLHLSHSVYELDSSLLLFELFLKVCHKVLDPGSNQEGTRRHR